MYDGRQTPKRQGKKIKQRLRWMKQINRMRIANDDLQKYRP